MLSLSGSRLIRRQHSGPPRPASGHTCRAFTVSYKHTEHTINIIYMINTPPLCITATSPCWSELGGACSHWYRGRGICWFVRRPVGLELPAPGRWTPAWRGAARHRDRPQPQLSPTLPHPALLLPPRRTHAGRTPGGQNRRNVLKKMLKCVSLGVKRQIYWGSYCRFEMGVIEFSFNLNLMK